MKKIIIVLLAIVYIVGCKNKSATVVQLKADTIYGCFKQDTITVNIATETNILERFYKSIDSFKPIIVASGGLIIEGGCKIDSMYKKEWDSAYNNAIKQQAYNCDEAIHPNKYGQHIEDSLILQHFKINENAR